MELDHRYVKYFSVCSAGAVVVVDFKVDHFDDGERTCFNEYERPGRSGYSIQHQKKKNGLSCTESARVQHCISRSTLRLLPTYPTSIRHGDFRLMSFSQGTNYLGSSSQDSALTDTSGYGEVEIDRYDASTSLELPNDYPYSFQRSRMAVGYCSSRSQTTFNAVSVPLSHPTPELHSQRVCTINVERLEQTAERLSSSSADIGSEIRELGLAQKRRSSSSASNPFVPTDTTCHELILSPMHQLSVSVPKSIKKCLRLPE